MDQETRQAERGKRTQAAGFIYKEIGDKLNIGTTTVRTYVENICQKLHVRNRLEAVAKHQSKSN